MRAVPNPTPVSGTSYAVANASSDQLVIVQKGGGRWEITLAAANVDSFVLNRRFFLNARLP
jgi:hypothetical protein